MEYYSAIKKSEIALFTGKDIELEITISTKIRETQINVTFAIMCRTYFFLKREKMKN